MRLLTTVLVSVAVTTSAAGEPATFQGTTFSRAEAVVGIGLTIPLDGARQSEAPRVELRMARDVMKIDGSRQIGFGPDQMGTRIGFSLAPGHRLLINGKPIDESRRHGVSTIGWIAIGVAATVVVGGVLLVDAARDASE